jgi:hypothetical protein
MIIDDYVYFHTRTSDVVDAIRVAQNGGVDELLFGLTERVQREADGVSFGADLSWAK